MSSLSTTVIIIYILACIRDQSTVKNTATITLKIVYPLLIDMGCSGKNRLTDQWLATVLHIDGAGGK